ncbi:phage holin family protein [Clostridium sp. KNHs214]|uniref:phage holin family protein n=1 Tax=Clostridium sp. KNHs214 TaxID=1540257 RepID=UPI0005519560|nr:phage holin family protein [Clostridium sp. KNHs214]
MSENRPEKEISGIVSYLIRLVVTAVVVSITAFLTPGFTIDGLWPLLLASVVISVLDYLVERFMKVDASPFGKGIKGFLIAALILYLTQFIVPTMRVTILGALIAAVIIGIVDAIIPGRVM